MVWHLVAPILVVNLGYPPLKPPDVTFTEHGTRIAADHHQSPGVAGDRLTFRRIHRIIW